MSKILFSRVAALFVAVFLFSFAHMAYAGESVYGALYEVANLEAETGSNTESVVTYYPGDEGFIAITTNQEQGGVAEWFVSDAQGITWERAETNPLEEYSCQQPGRHGVVMFDGEVYFGAACEDGATVFKLTGINTVERVHVKEATEIQVEFSDPNQNPDQQDPNQEEPDQEGDCPTEDGTDQENPDQQPDQGGDLQTTTIGDPNQGDPDQQDPNQEGDCPSQELGDGGGIDTNFPTAAVVGENIYMFYNGGYSVFDGESWSDVTDTEGQPDGVPLEASDELDGVIYLAFTSGEVMAFDGSSYETIAEDFIDGYGTNLPAVEVFNGHVYVGSDAGDGSGARLYGYDLNADEPEWEEVVTLDNEDSIINKMEASMEVDGVQVLTFYTSNATTGTNIYYLDAEGTIGSMVNSGLGEENAENNREVVSITSRVVTDGSIDRTVMVFGTQNTEDETKLFVLMLGTDFAIEKTNVDVLSAPVVKEQPAEGTEVDEKATSSKRKSQKTTKLKTQRGKTFVLQIKKADVVKGDVYSLWVNGEKVAEKTATSKHAITLKYKKGKNWKAGKKVIVYIGHQVSYGQGDDELLSTNTILGDAITVNVSKKK